MDPSSSPPSRHFGASHTVLSSPEQSETAVSKPRGRKAHLAAARRSRSAGATAAGTPCSFQSTPASPKHAPFFFAGPDAADAEADTLTFCQKPAQRPRLDRLQDKQSGTDIDTAPRTLLGSPSPRRHSASASTIRCLRSK